jgi:RNA polymerase primary sigma factor
MVSTASKPLETQRRRSSDPVSWYLSTIGRIPLLTAAEEIELGNQVQAMMAFTEDGSKDFKVEDLTTKQRRMLRIGRRAKERMMKANLRLVVSVAKKYQGKGLELLDLIQEGSLGLERAVEKFDPTRGYKFSTYAFWWIRPEHDQGHCLPVPHNPSPCSSQRTTHHDSQSQSGFGPQAWRHAEPLGNCGSDGHPGGGT